MSGVAYPPPNVDIFNSINYNTDFFTAEDAEALLSGYVKKTGSAMTGQLTVTTGDVNNPQIKAKNTNSNAAAVLICEGNTGLITAYGQGGSASPSYTSNNGYVKSINSLTIATGANNPVANTIPTMIVHSNQNIGIGTTNPTNRLEVVGVISSTTGITSGGGISGASISGSTISTLSTFINSNSATGLPTIGFTGGTGDRIIVDTGSGAEYPHSIGVSADNSMWYSIPAGTRHQFYAGGSNILTLFGSTVLPIMTWRGNFDITTSVSTGNQFNMSSSVASGYVNFLITNNEGFGCAIGVGGTSFTGNHRNNAFISANRDIIFNTFGRGSTSIPDMIITSNTTVGIGTGVPSSILDIYGASPRLTVRTTAESQNCILYLGTPNTSNSALKCALIAEGLSTFSRSKLHICLNNTNDNSAIYTAGIVDHVATFQYDGNVGIGNSNPMSDGGVTNFFNVGDASVANSIGAIVVGRRDNVGSTRQFRMGLLSDFSFRIGDFGSNNVIGGWTDHIRIEYTALSGALYIDNTGKCNSYGYITYSDIKLKTDIKTINNALWKVQQLRGVYYKHITEGTDNIGLIAQEVEGIIPEVVSYNDKNDTKGVNYSNMVAVLINAIKEQQEIIDSQGKTIENILSILSRNNIV